MRERLLILRQKQKVYDKSGQINSNHHSKIRSGKVRFCRSELESLMEFESSSPLVELDYRWLRLQMVKKEVETFIALIIKYFVNKSLKNLY